MSRRWTPERILECGIGPAHVARVLASKGWSVVLAEPEPDGSLYCEVIAVKGEVVRHLFDRATNTRTREAKMLSEALGGRYSCSGRNCGPADWPPDWDMDRHNLTARLLAAGGGSVDW